MLNSGRQPNKKFNTKINYILFFSFLFITKSIAQCPPNIYAFYTQAEVNNFQNEYPDCDHAHVLSFWGNDISDLSPLSYIGTISHLQFNGTDNITSLMAFDNTQIIMTLYIEDSDGILNLDGIHFTGNEQSTWLFLKNNSILENIAALDVLNLTIENVTIMNNPNLSQCAVKRVCASLNLETSTVAISNNGVGCNSQEEVAAVCQTMGMQGFELDSKIVVAPNPTSSIIEVTTLADISIDEIKLYNQLGQQVMISRGRILDINHLAKGIYFLKISSDKRSITKKIVKQ